MPVSRLTAEGLAGEIAATYSRAEVRLLRLIGTHLSAGVAAPDWAEAKLAELQMFRRRAAAVVAQATAEAVGQTGTATATAYLRGAAAAEIELGALGRATDNLAPRQAERAVEALVRAQADALEAMAPQIVRQATDGYRDAVVRASAGTLTGAATRLQDAQHALDDLARQGISGFTDRAGRQWGLQSYVDMATRTTTAQAAVTGHMDRLEDAGISLFIVSDSPRECDLCRPWEGKILTRGATNAVARNALTGVTEQVRVDGTVADATSAGLFHPNCTHNLSAYVHGATKRGTATADPKGNAEKVEQRRLERKVREWKRREAAAITPEARALAKGKVRQWQGAVNQHTKSTGLPRKYNRESFDVTPPKAPGPHVLDQVDLADLDVDVIDAQVADLMTAGDYGPRMERLAAELDRRQAVTATIPQQPGGMAEQALVRGLFDEPSAEDLAAWARYDQIVAEHAGEGSGHLAGLTVKQQREEYDTWAYTQWLRAEEDTRGNLLNRAGVANRIDAERFFDGSLRPAEIRKYATPELLEWFGANPRMSFDEFRALNGGTSKSAKAARDRFRSRTLGEWG